MTDTPSQDPSQNSNQQSSGYAQWFRDSAPYIQAQRGKTVVIALPDGALASGMLKNIVNDISLLNTLGIKVALCFGARQQISASLAADNVQSDFHNHLRVTSKEDMLAVQKEVDELRSQLESLFFMGLANTPEHHFEISACSGNFIAAKPLGILFGIDFQHTGMVRRVNQEPINNALNSGQVVLLPPIGFSATGDRFNLSVYDVAANTASSLQADKLIIYSEQGALIDEQGQRISALSQEQASQHWLDNSSPLSESATLALSNGVPRVQLISYLHDGSLLQELFTRDGEGTLIYRDHYETIRPATLDDAAGILALIEPLEKQQALVKRSRDKLENEIAYFWVADRDGMVVGCSALYPLDDDRSAELACVATHPDYRKSGLAARILKQLASHAKEQRMNQLFVLTTQAEHWFIEQGFQPSSVEQLPTERQSFYNNQRNSKVFLKIL